MGIEEIMNNELPVLQVGYGGLIIETNTVAQEIFGGDFSNENIDDLFPEINVNVLREGKCKPFQIDQVVGDKTYSLTILDNKPTNSFYILGVDITDKRNLEIQLQRTKKEETIGTLAGGIAHDLNNILSGLVSYPDLLLMDLPEDSPLRKPILTIQKSGQRAVDMVRDILTLAGRGISSTQPTNLNKVISDYLKTPENQKFKSDYSLINMEINLETGLLNILGSPHHLNKTINNLLYNAAQAMPDGGVVNISTQNRYVDAPIKGYEEIKEGDYVTLTFSDTGIISLEDIQRIFEPFYAKKVLKREKNGLGMAVVRGIVKDHNGYINVQSAEGEGTTFTLYFPATREEVTKDEAPGSIDGYTGKGESILVVDDAPLQGEIASGILKKLGYSVEVVPSGEDAVEYMKEHSVDLLVLDMIMNPGISGVETYERILEIRPGQKAIIASGFSEPEDIKRARELGAGQYIKKPYTLETIGIAVRNELNK